jgi:hypothetical protein
MYHYRPKRSAEQPGPANQDQLIITRWKALSSPAVGTRELSVIQSELGKRFGSSAVRSPASIARILADAGAELRHPEVIEFDALWRAEKMRETTQASEVTVPALEDALTLTQVADLIRELEQRRLEASSSEEQGIRSVAIKARETAQRHARRKSLGQFQKVEQQEIAEWLGVWIKTPSLFSDWLELRKRSAEFRRKFFNESQ